MERQSLLIEWQRLTAFTSKRRPPIWKGITVPMRAGHIYNNTCEGSNLPVLISTMPNRAYAQASISHMLTSLPPMIISRTQKTDIFLLLWYIGSIRQPRHI